MNSIEYFLGLLVMGVPFVGCNGGVYPVGFQSQTNAGTGTSTQAVGGINGTGGTSPISAAGGVSPASTGGTSTQPDSAMGGIHAAGTGGVASMGGSDALGGTAATGGRAPGTGGTGVGGGKPPITGGAQPVATGGIGPVQTGGNASGGSNPPTTGGAQPIGTGGIGPVQTGGNVSGGSSGQVATGGATTGGSETGGAMATGGSIATTTGGTVTGGASATGGTVAATGGTSNPHPITGPCDIYLAASPVTPCVAAYSTTRLLNGKYTGPLYQVRKGGSSSGTGGTLTDIMSTADGFADASAHDATCGTSGCTFAVLYDQSGNGNDLKVAPAGCYSGTAALPDYESSAVRKSINLSGHKAYALYMNAQEGYRNNTSISMPTGSQSQGIYELVDGTRYGTACCWDFGNASKNNCYGATGNMNALFFGTGYWGKGIGGGPWVMADLEGGVWATGSGLSNAVNDQLPSSNVPFAFGLLKTGAATYAIRVGNAQSGSLTTGYDGPSPVTFAMSGGIVLGISGDNSNFSYGPFFEGAITAGRPSDATDAAILANVQAAMYGQ
jgi:non-reducing end alpha-L-arabinofuranosidase